MPAGSLTTRLVVLLTVTIAVTLTAITLLDYLTSRARLLKAQEARVESTVARAVRDLEVRLSVLEESTELLAEIVARGDYPESELRALLREAVDERDDLFGAALALNPRFASNPEVGFAAYFYYRNGEVIYSDLSRAVDYVLSSWYREAASLGRPIWTEPYFDDGGGNVNMVTYSVPMFRQVNGERVIYGVVTADITLDEVQYYLDRMELGERGFGFMLSRSGKIIASPSREDWLQPWTGIIDSAGEASRWAALISRVAAGEKGSARVTCLDMPDDCIVKLAPLETTRWPVGAYYAEHEMLAPLRDYLMKSALSQLATLALLLVGVVWVSRSITRPLRSLALATADIATGDFHTRLPEHRRADELGRLVHAFSLMQDNLQRYIEELREQTASRNRLEGELDAASAIQMSMLPGGGQAHVVEDRFVLWATLHPAKSVGGDLYAFYLQGPEKLLVAVGDVSDKGVPAALFMARAMTLLQQQVNSTLDASEILTALNNELVQGNDSCMFLTLFVGWLDLDTLSLDFACGGHTPPLLVRDGTASTLLVRDGPALGLVENQAFPLNHIVLQAEDRLALFTDGIEEAFNTHQQQFGLDAVTHALEDAGRQNLMTAGQSLLEAVARHQGDAPPSDDITLLLLMPRAAGSERNRLTVENDAYAVATLQAWLDQLLSASPAGAAVLVDTKLVAEEVVTNIFKYGELTSGQGVTLTLELSADRLVLEFIDCGLAFDPLTEARRSELGSEIESAAIGGLGVHLIEGLTDEQHYQRVDCRNRLTLIKFLVQP